MFPKLTSSLKAASIFTLCVAGYALTGCSDDSTSDSSVTADSGSVKAEATNVAAKPVITDVFNVGQNTYVRSLEVDAARNSLWVGTSLGAQEIDLDDHSVKNTFTREHGLANEYIFAINVDAEGTVWFGTNAGGVSRYKDEEWKTYFPMHGLADYWIYCFANDANGDLWIGTWAGANHLNKETDKMKTYVTELVNEWVYGLDIDEKGQVWFGTEGGVSMLNGDTWTHWTHEDGMGAVNEDKLPFSKNTGLGTRTRHDLGILSGGMATYNPNYVFSVLVDQDQSIWAGTWGGGVSHFKDGEWTNLTAKDGLAGDIVYSIAQDQQGNYWFGTNNGVSYFDGKNWTNFSIQNGMPGNNVYAIEITEKGDVWLGTRGGVTRITHQ